MVVVAEKNIYIQIEFQITKITQNKNVIRLIQESRTPDFRFKHKNPQ